ncbi:MAG TPA: glycosyltransferase [Xanthomonadaceae bacterium]|nr:glycosyltransferase [Xanthomonadaceae bacterium]
MPAMQAGGAERSTVEIAAALVHAGHRAVVVSAGGRMESALLAAGGEHRSMDIGSKRLATWFRAGALARLLRDLKPDIVHARSRLPAWLGWRALRRAGLDHAHFVTTVHGLNRPGRWSSILTRGERVIAVSATVRAHLLAHYPALDAARIRVIPRGIDPAAFPRGYRPDAAWNNAFFDTFPQLRGGRLLTLPGRGTRLKGHAHAVRLLADLRARGVDARLLLLGAADTGRGGYFDEIHALARELGVREHMAVSPQREDVRDVYALSDLVLQLSTQPEAFGRTVIEALALGRPVLGYDHGGVGELLRAHYAQGLSPAGDAQALAVRALALLEEAPEPPVLQGCLLADMQAATLAVYRELVPA